jgi:hypothetical protein
MFNLIKSWVVRLGAKKAHVDAFLSWLFLADYTKICAVESMGPIRSKNMNGFQWRERHYFLVPVFICPGLHIRLLISIIIFHAKKTQIMLVQSWRSLYSTSSLFSEGRKKALKEVKTISWGMCRVPVMPMGRLSVLSTPVAGSVPSHTNV